MKAKFKLFLFVFLLIGLFFSSNLVVFARPDDGFSTTTDLDWKKTTITCTYSDGSAFTYEYSKTDGEFIVNRESSSVSGSSRTSQGAYGSIAFANNNEPINTSTHMCHSNMIFGVLTTKQKVAGEKYEYETTYYKFSDSSSTSFEVSDILDSTNFWTWFFALGENETWQLNNTLKSTELVSERIDVASGAGTPAEYYYKSEPDLKGGNTKYLTIHKYNNAIVLESPDATTLIDQGSSLDDTIYVNDPSAKYTQSSSGYVVSYDAVRYQLGSGTKYTRTLTDESGDGDNRNELCTTIMPNTSLVLKRIINIIQLLAPVLLIILCALDLGKIVMAGKLDDELPKQRSKIIRRFIVAVAIFFLPLIVHLLVQFIINANDGKVSEQIQQIDCLFD